MVSRKGIFITGTDTDVGKTYVGTQIVTLLHENSINVVPRKPIESGCIRIQDALVPQDAHQYYEATNRKFPLAEVCPFRFEPAISPQRAARLANQPVYTEEAFAKCVQGTTHEDFLVVEGAGGFYSPLCEDGMNSDLAKRLGLSVLLVANDKLGCINHILLTIEAIRTQGLSACAVILNQIAAHDTSEMNNFDDVAERLRVPVFTISHQEVLQNTTEKARSILLAVRGH
ncbi:MAG: dethiobiotin synthase [Gammaproteobacteria bacterium]|nr:dethiobiotin synthase [Gammaproteobacteria bacterium]